MAFFMPTLQRDEHEIMAEPKFLIIKRYITNKITSKTWGEHMKVPSENELSSQFSVSRMTARRALQELTKEGVLTRTQGLGTFVACLKTQSSLLTIRNIADEIHARGHTHTALVHKLEQSTADTATAIALELPVDSQIYFSQLVHFENDMPLQLEDRFVNKSLVKDYLKQDFTETTPHVYLSQIAPLTQATHTIEAITPNEMQIKLLRLSKPEPCLLITRRTWSAQGIVSVARLTCPGSRYRLDSQLTI